MRRALVGLAALTMVGLAAGVADAADQERMFQFQDDRITESSGLAASTKHDGIVYTHNDSDAGPDLFAVDDSSGETVAVLTLNGAPARDWEAMTRCENDETLWVGDIGDNIDAWKTYRLYRVPEPDTLRTGNVEFTQYDIRYADGRARDAEALLCDPRNGRLYIVSKENESQAAVYRGPATMKAGAVNTFTRIASAPAGVTDGAFFAGGRFAVLRGYFEARIVSPNADWKSVVKFTPPIQMQGESVAESADGEDLLFGSEGIGSTVWRVPIPEDVKKLPNSSVSAQDAKDAAKDAKDKGKKAADDAKKAGRDAAKDTSDDIKRVNDEGIPGIDGQMVALFSALGLGLLVLVLATRRD
ncbi:hypothetical protein [Sporichthya polymorpha]|uniref:hypothetical protein n=1 Tax=Sporichthya polymorpha TaxID=35751 RepID=UPI0012ECB895|nr:hypothetical protein [Sporichthya polymorpha]